MSFNRDQKNRLAVLVEQKYDEPEAMCLKWTMPDIDDPYRDKWAVRLEMDRPWDGANIEFSARSNQRCTVDVFGVPAGTTVHLTCSHPAHECIKQDVVLSNDTVEEPPLSQPIGHAIALIALMLALYFHTTTPWMT